MAPLSCIPGGLSRCSITAPDAAGLEDDGGRAAAAPEFEDDGGRAAAAPEFEDDGGRAAAAPDAPDAPGLEDPAPGLSLGGMKIQVFLLYITIYNYILYDIIFYIL